MKDKKPLDPPSQEFLHAFTHVGSITATCDFCGRTLFGTSAHYEEGELDGLREKAKTSEKYIEVDYDTISIVEIEGKNYPWDCPCNAVRQYENWIWAHRKEIAAYLNSRSKKELEEAIATRRAVKVSKILMHHETSEGILEEA